MRVENVEWKLDEGFQPYISLTLDGQPAMIIYEQNPPKAGAVLLAPSSIWEKLPQVVIPADPTQGRGELVLDSATDDPEVVKLWWDLYRAEISSEFKEGPRPVTKAMTFVDKSTAAPDLEPDRQAITQRLRQLLYASLRQIGKSITVDTLQSVLDAYKLEPNDERHPIDVWIGLLGVEAGWFAMLDITTEMAGLFSELYNASVPVVLRRFVSQAFNQGAATSLSLPLITVIPDSAKLAQHAEEVLDSIDEGTLYFIAKYLSEHPNRTAQELINGLVPTLFLSGVTTNLCDSRVNNINNLENTWVMERCALDLLATLGMTRKVWKQVGEPHSPHCLANERRGAVALDALYGTDYGRDTLFPPSSPSCGCELSPSQDELPLLASKLTVDEKAGVVPDEAVVWIDVPDGVAESFGLQEAGIELLYVPGRSLEELNAALNSLSYMVRPFGMLATGDTGVRFGEDVAWCLVTPKVIHARNTLMRLLEYPLDESYRPYIDMGQAGTTGAAAQLDFGDPWMVYGLRLCVRLGGRDECRYYPFLQPLDSENAKSRYANAYTYSV